MNYNNNFDESNPIDFQTGDILLFNGNTSGGNCLINMLSCCIKFCTSSKFSHCGIVIKDPDFFNEPKKGLYILESTGLEEIPDIENNEHKFGVQLRELIPVIRNYKGTVFYRKLTCIRDKLFYRRLRSAHSVVHNRPYDAGIDYIKALFDEEVGDLQKKDTFFCSALVSYIYVSLGLLPFSTPWSIITPHDLSTEPHRPIYLHFENCTVDPEIQIYP